MMTILSNILENLKPPYIIETKNYGEFWSRKSFILHDRGDAIIPYWAIKGEENEGLHLKDSYIRNLIKSAKNHRDKYKNVITNYPFSIPSSNIPSYILRKLKKRVEGKKV